MSTTFSGPVISTAGFTGNVTGLALQGSTPTAISAAGAIPLTNIMSLIYPAADGTAGALAMSLGAGTAGQMKIIKYDDGTYTANIVVTPVRLVGGTTLTFNAKGEVAELVSDGSSWHIVVNSSTLG